MTKQFIYATDIVLPKTVIGLFDGSEQFCFENPYFSVPGITKPDMKTFLELKGTQSKFGVMLKQNYIFLKGANGVFSKNYAIGYTETVNTGTRIDKKAKDYYIMKPFEVKDLSKSYKYKLIVSPAKGEILKEDIVLITLDYQFSMAMDVLSIAKILDIDLSKYKGKNNEAFYKAFINDINAIIKPKGAKKEIDYDEEFVKSFNEPPIIGKNERGDITPVCILDDGKSFEPLFDTLFTKFYSCVASIKKQFKGWERVLQRPNCAAFPSIKFIELEKKNGDDTEYVKRFDGRFTFIIQLSSGDPGLNDKIYDGLITRQQMTKTKIDKLTKATLPKLWGGALSDDDKIKGATQRGCLYIVPQPIYRYYEKGCPTIDWRVEKISCRRIASSADVDYDEGCDFLGDAEDPYGEDAPTPHEPTEEEHRDAADAQFVGNEKEVDPSAF